MQSFLPTPICSGHSFAQLGGDSLSALRFITALKQRNISVSLAQLLQLPDMTKLECAIQSNFSSSEISEETIQWEKEWSFSHTHSPSSKNFWKSNSEDTNKVNAEQETAVLDESVLLTGATGFLGPFLAFELLNQYPTWKVVCLVRGSSDAEALARLKQHAELLRVWDEELALRLQVFKSDISAPRFGLTSRDYEALTRSVRCVVHNAARVHGILPYRDLKLVNVDPIPAIVHFCGEKRAKTLLHVSSVNVLRPPDYHPEVALSSVPCPSLSLAPGYAQSKYVAERMLETCMSAMSVVPRGVLVVRPATISAHSLSGACNLTDFTTSFVAGHILLGCYPSSLRGIPENLLLTPVDFVSRALVQLLRVHCSLAPSPTISFYHLSTPLPCSWLQLVDYIRSFGYRLVAVNDAEYCLKLKQMNPSNPLYMFQEQLVCSDGFSSLSHSAGPSQHKTLAALDNAASDWPCISEAMFRRQLEFMQLHGKIPFAPSPALPLESSLQRYFDCPFYRMENWYPVLESLTFPTTFFPLSPVTIQAVRKLKSDIIRQRIKPKRKDGEEFMLRVSQVGVSVSGARQTAYAIQESATKEEERWQDWKSELDSWSDDDNKDAVKNLLASLHAHLEPFVKKDERGAFVRLSTRSPKDSAVWSPIYRRLIKQGCTATYAAYRALEVFSASDAFSLLLKSDRVFHDLLLCERLRLPAQVCVRQFCEFDPEWEFRAFAFNGALTAISHYRLQCSAAVFAQRDELSVRLRDFWDTQIRALIFVRDYSVDLVVHGGEVRVVEVNYPAPIANSILFDWESSIDRMIVTQGPYQLRLR